MSRMMHLALMLWLRKAVSVGLAAAAALTTLLVFSEQAKAYPGDCIVAPAYRCYARSSDLNVPNAAAATANWYLRNLNAAGGFDHVEQVMWAGTSAVEGVEWVEVGVTDGRMPPYQTGRSKDTGMATTGENK